jgi:folate-dependent phosphoribosylglycinamide formyltransferase PurN
MNIVMFVSGRNRNLLSCLEVQDNYPELLSISLVVSDNLTNEAIETARLRGIPVISRDFAAACGSWRASRSDPQLAEQYWRAAVSFHDGMLEEILAFERCNAKFDLAVLSYHHWIHGKLLEYFFNRMINQHSGDLSVLKPDGSRCYIGVNPVLTALRNGEKRTRSSTFLVTEGHDAGEILCQGPWVEFRDTEVTHATTFAHEQIQKIESDGPSVRFALREIALGRFGIADEQIHPQGRRVLTYDGQALPYAGVDLSKSFDQ